MMTNIETSAIRRSEGTTIGTMVVGWGLAARSALRAWHNRRVLARTVALMDNRMLADIGLTFGDVGSAFSEPLWRDPSQRLVTLAEDRRDANLQNRDARKPRPNGNAPLVLASTPVSAGRVPRVPRLEGHERPNVAA